MIVIGDHLIVWRNQQENSAMFYTEVRTMGREFKGLSCCVALRKLL